MPWNTVLDVLREATGSAGVPGAVISIHTAGALLDPHPHTHILVSWGVFDPDGTFVLARDTPSRETIEKLFRKRVLDMLVARERLAPETAEKLLAWHHPGFGGWVGSPVVAEGEKKEFPAEWVGYLVRAPISLERMRLEPDGSVVIRSDKPHPRHGGNERTFPDALEFIAALAIHIPPPQQKAQIAYGRYSNRSRGLRAKREGRRPVPCREGDRAPKAVRQAWARMIARVFELDPLLCPCGGKLRFVSAIEQEAVLHRILRHLGLLGLADQQRERAQPERAPPGPLDVVVEMLDHDPFPDYETPN